MLGEKAPPLVRAFPPVALLELLLSAEPGPLLAATTATTAVRVPRSAGVVDEFTDVEAAEVVELQGPANENGPCAGRIGDIFV